MKPKPTDSVERLNPANRFHVREWRVRMGKCDRLALLSKIDALAASLSVSYDGMTTDARGHGIHLMRHLSALRRRVA
jgi:hypothetical protein